MLETSRRDRVYCNFRFGGTMTTVTIWPPPTPKTVNVQKAFIDRDGKQVTVSTNTLFPWYHNNPRIAGTKLEAIYRNVDMGSAFYTSKVTISGGRTQSFHNQLLSNQYQDWVGHVLPWVPLNLELSTIGNLTPGETSNLMAAGTTAIARCIPTNPVSGLSNFLGELKRDGLPKRPGAAMRSEFERGKTLKGLSSEYLNWEFAVRPFYSDMRSFANVVKSHDKILKQYRRDSGKLIRRRYQFPTESTVVSSIVSSAYYPQGVNIPGSWFNSGVLHLETRTTVDRWFSGAFCYYLNFDDSVLGKLSLYEQYANKLLGTRLTPELVWNLTPWTWAADWETNAGDVIHNVSAFLGDGLVMKHGYVMEHKTITKTYTLKGFSAKTNVSGDCSDLSMSITQERKARLKASPFGFGLTDSDLSLRQKAIIAALGINRSAGLAK